MTPADDAWLDELEAHHQGALAGPLRELRRIFGFVRSTPGKMVVMMVVLTVAIGATGFAQSHSMAERQRSLDVLVNATEPMNHSAHVLLTSLAEADTVATTSFVQTGMMSEEEVGRYLTAVDAAVRAASDIDHGAAAIEDTASRERIYELVLNIQRDLPMYMALMERAKVNQRFGNPVGVAYMSEASGLMRERMLTNADTLFSLTQQQVSREMSSLNAPQWVPLSGLLAAIVFLLAAQWWLSITFRRRLNRGFLLATAAMVIATGWVSTSNYISWQSGVVGFERAATPWHQLTTARIAAQEARTDETLALLRRQSVAQSSRSFEATSNTVRVALGSAGQGPEVASASKALDDWEAAHDALMITLDTGRFERATDILVGQGPNDNTPSAVSSYQQLDADMATLIEQSRETMRDFIHTSLDATRRVSTAVAVLALLAVAGIWVGIRRRIGEYL